MQAMPHITSTRELPPHIPRMPNDTRSKVIHELYTTEYTYVHSLETLSEVSRRGLCYICGCGLQHAHVMQCVHMHVHVDVHCTCMALYTCIYVHVHVASGI